MHLWPASAAAVYPARQLADDGGVSLGAAEAAAVIKIAGT